MKAGTIITCPECEVEQMKTTKDIPPGSKMSEAGFESLGFDLEHSLRAACYKCGSLWYRKSPKTGRSQIHTQLDKWVPLGEPTENEKKIIITHTAPNTIQ
jgi:hypothetical protein